MMQRASGFFGLAALVLALIGPGAGTPAYGQDSIGQLTDQAPAQQQASPPFAVLQSWSFARDDSSAETTSRPFVVELPSESQTPSFEPAPAYDPPAERSNEPHDFRINDRLKVKAQPLGGGVGGRVTLTFSFDSGY